MWVARELAVDGPDATAADGTGAATGDSSGHSPLERRLDLWSDSRRCDVVRIVANGSADIAESLRSKGIKITKPSSAVHSE